ncbi:MAG: DUF1501 domain-containing protein [Planctomycetes bacterium]|nr:DUF1501 domain-containing protein [Planctomycetota bacterium]
MISLGGSRTRLCEGLTRREWLRVGGLSTLGLTLPDLLRGRAQAALPVRRPTAKSCIVVFLFGAPAHQDLWDMKPLAPSEYRGEFRPIASNVPGIFLGEHVPRIARVAHHLALIRSVAHLDNTHTVAMHYMLTGVRHPRPNTNPQNQPTDFPTFGAVMQKLRTPDRRRQVLPAGISLNAPANQVSANNHIFPGFFAGFLGSAHDPLFVPQDPSAADFRPFPTAEGDAGRRLRQRRPLVAEVDRRQEELLRHAAVRSLDAHYGRAFDLVTSPTARRAFDLSLESRQTRDRYGRSAFGQGLLLSRRLVEAGVPLVTVNWARDDAFWDTHADNFNLLKNSLLPPFDRGFSALLEDLHQRGLLDETLIVCLGEFGRTPRINRSAGRDHWAACNTVVLAGGGVRGGQVHGASDRLAAYPTTPPVSPEDLAATIYHTLGVDLDTPLYDPLGRPLPLCTGQPVTSLFH